MPSVMGIIGDWRIVVSLAMVAISALLVYVTSNFDYWRKRGFPEIRSRPLPFFGHTWKLMVGMKNFSDTFADIYKDLGDVPYGGFLQGTVPVLMVKDPEIIRRILVKDSYMFLDRGFHIDEELDPLNGKALSNLKGQRWKKMRASLSPAFTSGRMKAMLPLMQTCADEMLEWLRKENEKREAVIEIKELMSCYSTDVIATCAFGIHCDALRNPEASEFRKMGKLIFKSTWKRSILLLLFFVHPKLIKILKLRVTMDITSAFFRNFVQNVIESREKALEKDEESGKGTSKKFGDFIHHLVLLKNNGFNVTKEEKDETYIDDIAEDKNTIIQEEPSWSKINLDDLTAQVVQFFSAGFETTSSLLSFVLFELSATEDGKKIQNELRAEIDRVMDENDGKITYDGLKKMHLLDRVMSETLRLYPPAGSLNRLCLQDYTIPGTNLTVEKGTQVFIPTQELQRDPKYFANPMRFDPNRFLPEHKDKIEQYVYLPFGDGPRHCIGQRFAELQVRLGLACLISKFEFDTCRERTTIPLKFSPKAFILTAEGGLWFKIKQRIN